MTVATPHRVLLSVATVALLSTVASAQTLGTRATEFLFTKLTVSDLVTSLEYYTKIVGLKHASLRPGEPMPDPKGTAPLIEISLNFTGSRTDPFLVLQKQEGLTPTAETAGLTVVGVKVADARATVERVRAAGYKVEREPFEWMGITFAYVRDPDGYTVEFIQTPIARRAGQ